MQKTMLSLASACVAALVAAPAAAHDLGRQTLPPLDGWAAATTGTTGGADADADHVFTVTNRQELLSALNGQDPTPKIIYVAGTIDANVDDDNVPQTCEDYQNGTGYALEAYLAAYDPDVWGRDDEPSGPLETARKAAQQIQQGRVRIRIGANTTLVGIGGDAVLRGAWLDIRGTSTAPVDNIIIRNLTFQDTFDCFPRWDPTDGSNGNWNSQYDSISLRYATHVWIDHNVFEDRDTIDEGLPLYFGRLFQVHDGLLDITNASDLVTVSWNVFRHHDKVMLIGSSDSGSTAAGDRGKLRVTLHHNLFQDVNQRAPRVRFGQVHVYDNYYKIRRGTRYSYSWGVGIESAVFAENNFFLTNGSETPDQFIDVFKGTAVHVTGTLVDGLRRRHRVDVVAAYNEVNDPDLGSDVGWTPTLVPRLHPTQAVPALVQLFAGVFGWPHGWWRH